MTQTRKLVVDPDAAPVDDELRLPRPPGVVRRFWARHPLLADILIAGITLLISMSSLTVRTNTPEPRDVWFVVGAGTMMLVGCVALVWHRRWPCTVFAIAFVPSILVDTAMVAGIGLPAAAVAIYSIAVYRSTRACWIALGVACAVLAAVGAVRIGAQPDNIAVSINAAAGVAVALLVASLIGINVGNRRRYLLALIDRSRQLLIERDQRGQLAAAAERTRIAREMHDVVSHSLTVIVALSEGAAATADPARSRDASRAVSATARDALAEMRMMLGVLRDDSDDIPPFAPLLDASLQDVVAAAQHAGYPVTLAMTGVPDQTPIVRLALLRIVQEGLTNAMRYSHEPTFIRVRAQFDDAGLTVDVENDGARSGEHSRGAGTGLAGLRERVLHLGGSIEAGLIAPTVWRIRAHIPKEDTADGADSHSAR